jgi:hypothetical protein
VLENPDLLVDRGEAARPPDLREQLGLGLKVFRVEGR